MLRAAVEPPRFSQRGGIADKCYPGVYDLSEGAGRQFPLKLSAARCVGILEDAHGTTALSRGARAHEYTNPYPAPDDRRRGGFAAGGHQPSGTGTNAGRPEWRRT